MIIYNVTTKVDPSIHQAWLLWLREEHIPGILQTGCFTRANILRLLEIDESDGPTYAIQYHAASKSLYNQYIEKFANFMLQQSLAKWGDRFISFSSVLQVID